jgi:hypothetical protein
MCAAITHRWEITHDKEAYNCPCFERKEEK